MTDAAKQFVDSLDAKQQAAAVFPFSDARREVWNYVPLNRPGVSLAEMTADQRTLGKALLRSALSAAGAQKVEEIRLLESVLREIENGNPGRDLQRYWFAFYGSPSDETPWTWRYEGHHVSLSFTILGGKLASSSPQFLGTNPAHSHDPADASPSNKGKRILGKEQDLGFELVRSLDVGQLKLAQIATVAPADIVTSNSRKAALEGRQGIPYANLKPKQQGLLKALIRAHTEVQADAERDRRLAMIEREGYAQIVFAWMGPVAITGRHYYRIQGQGFLIEFDCTQDNGNHFHAVWRQLGGDFPADPLQEHYGHDRH